MADLLQFLYCTRSDVTALQHSDLFFIYLFYTLFMFRHVQSGGVHKNQRSGVGTECLDTEWSMLMATP